MKRSPGVTASAVVALFGSVLAILFGLGTIALTFIVSAIVSNSADLTRFPARPPTALLAIAALIYLLPGAWGFITGVGLLRLKNWARISTVVFAVLLILSGAFWGVTILVLSAWVPPPNTQADAATMASAMKVARVFMAVIACGLVALGTWWAIFFTRPKVALQFAAGAGDPAGVAPGRPVSITIVAWFLLVSSPFIGLSIAMRSPMPFFVTTLTGAGATALLLAMGVVILYAGIGLLRLRPAARLAAMAYFVFAILNSAVFFLAPGGHARLTTLMAQQEAMMPALVPPGQQTLPFDPTALVYVSMVVGLLVTAVPLYFLVTRKHAFTRA